MVRGTRRDQKKEEFWRRRLRAQAGSGLSVRAWCRRQDTRESAFYWWRARLARSAAEAPAFAAVQVLADAGEDAAAGAGGKPAGRIEIVLPSHWRVRVIGPVERPLLAAVLAVLATAPDVSEADERVSAVSRC